MDGKEKPVPILEVPEKKKKRVFCERGGMKIELYLNEFCTGPNKWESRVECTGWADCLYYLANCPYYHDPGPPAFDSFGGWA